MDAVLQQKPIMETNRFEVNGRQYSPPKAPLVVICIDGCADEYLSHSILHGRMPRTAAMIAGGYRGFVRAALPTFTNVNNAAIVSGTPPAKTGICGNYFIDPATGDEVMMNDPKFLRNETILAAAQRAGRRVAFVTAKDKLRKLLSKGLEPSQSIAFSAEKAGSATLTENGIDDVETLVGPTPDIYSGDASIYTLRAGAELIKAARADFLYLSLTDYMQHAFAPDHPASLEFYSQIDAQIGALLDLGAIVGATADHGMNAKCHADGTPRVLFLEDALQEQFGEQVTVICPITDPYVVHHGALGSAVWLHVPPTLDPSEVEQWVLSLDGVTEVYSNAMAAKKLELAPDRIGDVVVLSGRDVVLGKSPSHHDLGLLKDTLRSHGGRYEEMVPMLLSRPLNAQYDAVANGDPRNWDIFDFTCNGGR